MLRCVCSGRALVGVDPSPVNLAHGTGFSRQVLPRSGPLRDLQRPVISEGQKTLVLHATGSLHADGKRKQREEESADLDGVLALFAAEAEEEDDGLGQLLAAVSEPGAEAAEEEDREVDPEVAVTASGAASSSDMVVSVLAGLAATSSMMVAAALQAPPPAAADAASMALAAAPPVSAALQAPPPAADDAASMAPAAAPPVAAALQAPPLDGVSRKLFVILNFPNTKVSVNTDDPAIEVERAALGELKITDLKPSADGFAGLRNRGYAVMKHVRSGGRNWTVQDLRELARSNSFGEFSFGASVSELWMVVVKP